MSVSNPLRIILQAPGFFSIPLKKIEIETNAIANRTYFLHGGRIVAVAIRSNECPVNNIEGDQP